MLSVGIRKSAVQKSWLTIAGGRFTTVVFDEKNGADAATKAKNGADAATKAAVDAAKKAAAGADSKTGSLFDLSGTKYKRIMESIKKNMDVFVRFKQSMFIYRSSNNGFEERYQSRFRLPPQVYVIECQGSLFYHIPMGGFEKEEIEIERKGRFITITGEKGSDAAGGKQVVVGEIVFPQGVEYKRDDFNVEWMKNEVVIELMKYPNKKEKIKFNN